MISLFLTFAALAGTPHLGDSPENREIAVQNTILAQVNGKTISVLDVMKKLDVVFYEQYSHLAESTPARCQFYEMSWRTLLQEMVDHELIVADALAREIEMPDADIREELEKRFGPNVMKTLDEIGLLYDEAWKLVKDDLIVQRMTGYFVYAKAMQTVTPQDIRQAYRLYLKEHPPYREWSYQILSIPTGNTELANEVYQALVASKKSPEEAETFLEEQFSNLDIQISTEYNAKDIDLSDSYQTILSSLTEGTYSAPIARSKGNHRIFYLKQSIDKPAPSFDLISNKLKNELFHKAIAAESERYVTVLRKKYGFDNSYFKQTLPEDLQPFTLE